MLPLYYVRSYSFFGKGWFHIPPFYVSMACTFEKSFQEGSFLKALLFLLSREFYVVTLNPLTTCHLCMCFRSTTIKFSPSDIKGLHTGLQKFQITDKVIRFAFMVTFCVFVPVCYTNFLAKFNMDFCQSLLTTKKLELHYFSVLHP